ncbi:MAG: MBL fold metallo-hydrolase [Planctomycetales bacterium]|nr:MBL fold metallo-hydrolase [Planctomycetales bacterium]
MKLHFLGANRQVTGSRYCLETDRARVMIDCGLFQERPFAGRNWSTCPLPPASLDAMLLTHAHIDHSGLIPRLVREGFRQTIHATSPTVALCDVMLRDSAEIQMEDAAYKRKRHQREGRRGRYPEEPLYTEEDVDRTMPLFEGVGYGQAIDVAPGISATFFDAGHILGSSMILVTVEENSRTRTILFSGDVGQWEKPIIRDPTLFKRADYVVMESTYGDRDHEDAGDVATQLEHVIRETIERGGNVVIPTFAVERAQELMYFISGLIHDGRVPKVKVFLDSPMAVDVTEIFRRYREYFDQETWQRINSQQSPLHFPGLHFASTVDQSKAINHEQAPSIIMATSGMCTGGRIKHHLRQNITDPRNTILFVGYQGVGTLGREILDRPPYVRIHGRDYKVAAEVRRIYGFSGHADRSALWRWLTHLEQPPQHVFLTHGEETVALALADRIRRELQWTASVPEYQSVVDLG